MLANPSRSLDSRSFFNGIASREEVWLFQHADSLRWVVLDIGGHARSYPCEQRKAAENDYNQRVDGIVKKQKQ